MKSRFSNCLCPSSLVAQCSKNSVLHDYLKLTFDKIIFLHSDSPCENKSIKQCNYFPNSAFRALCKLGVKVRNTKMDLNICSTWRRVTFEKLMMEL